MESSGSIPVIDFSTCSEMEVTAQRIVEAFSDVGFVYLLNHGLSADLLLEAFSRSSDFFRLPVDVKAKYRATPDTDYQGYFGLGHEAFDSSAPGDMKESFDFTVATLDAPIWPTEVDKFKDVLARLFEECAGLSRRILKVLACGLGLDDEDFFVRCHNISTTNQPYASCLRTLYYPPVTPESFKRGQTRLGEHTDYGTMTLVFQDPVGGLQVRGPDGGGWIDARPIEGSVLVNIADLLQRWTSDRLTSTPHRIVLPDDRMCSAARQSLVFFVNPDPDTEIRCVDGSDRYDPVQSGEYQKKRILETAAFPY